MPPESIIDVDRLSGPVSAETPCGVDLRWDTLYDDLRKARQQGDRGAFEGEAAAEPDWSFVVDQACELLATRTKDLMLAGWLTEALLHSHGFAGVRDGFKVLNALIANFWEGLYPLPDESDWEPRIAPLVWLTEPDRGARLGNLLFEVPLAVNQSGDQEVFSYRYWEARNPKGSAGDDAEAYQRRQEEAVQKGQRFDDAVAAMPRSYYADLMEAIQACQAEVLLFDQALDRLLGRDAPGTTAIRDALSKCADLVRRMLRDKGGAEPAAEDQGALATAAETGGDAPPLAAGAAGPLQSREDAFRKLQEIAVFLRRTEPQSPVPYLIERAVAWGRLPFDRLLAELIKDEASRGHVVELLGIKDNSQ